MFEWDRNNLGKIRAHGIKREEAQQTLANDPIPIYEQDVEGRLLAVILTERGDKLRVVTAYDLDAGQKRDYYGRRMQGE